MQANKQRILIVEDDALLADITAFRLELLGYDVEILDSTERALKLCDQQMFDLVVVDLELAGQKGLDLINQFQVSERLHETPILAFSSDPNLDVVEQAFKAGAKDYLVTPYDPAVLEDKVERLFSGRLVETK